KEAKGGDAWLITVTWADFKKLFFLQFLPRAEQERLKREAAAGTEEEHAKNFQWGLHRSTLNHLMCMSYTDVAQVANAARNYEILHERDDEDNERPDKRKMSGDRHQPTSQQSSHRSRGHNNDRHGSDRRGGSDNHRSSNNNYSGSNNRGALQSQLLSASRREDRPEVTLPPRKRLDIALGPRYEGAPVSTDTELGGYVREVELRVRQDMDEIYMRLDDE
nr:hypothetical protein [Tanacetum cinerariifolium]